MFGDSAAWVESHLHVLSAAALPVPIMRSCRASVRSSDAKLSKRHIAAGLLFSQMCTQKVCHSYREPQSNFIMSPRVNKN